MAQCGGLKPCVTWSTRPASTRRARTRRRLSPWALSCAATSSDTYFAVHRGRLKLREIEGAPAELISYLRDEDGAGRASDYEVFRTDDPAVLREVLSGALGVLAVVRKHRRLLVLDGSRIHLDNVGGLGSFLELEVPVEEDDAPARERIDWLLDAMGLDWSRCIRASYLDLTTETMR